MMYELEWEYLESFLGATGKSNEPQHDSSQSRRHRETKLLPQASGVNENP